MRFSSAHRWGKQSKSRGAHAFKGHPHNAKKGNCLIWKRHSIHIFVESGGTCPLCSRSMFLLILLSYVVSCPVFCCFTCKSYAFHLCVMLSAISLGKFEWGKSSYKHWFDGQALMHKFQVTKGRVLYSSQFLHSNSYDKSKKYGRVAMPGFATWAPPDPCKSIFQRFFLYFLPPALTDNCNINFIGLKDDTYASTETPHLYKVDPDSLETVVEEDLRATLPGIWSFLFIFYSFFR